MAGTIATTTNGLALVNSAVTVKKEIIPDLHAQTVFSHIGEKAVLAKNQGTLTARWYRGSNLSVDQVPVALGETENTDSQKIDRTAVTATVQFYGTSVSTSTRAEATHELNIPMEVRNDLTVQAGRTRDRLSRNLAEESTQVRYANGVANRASIVLGMRDTDMNYVINQMRRDSVLKVNEMIDPSTAIGTVPVFSSYDVIAHPDVTDEVEILYTGDGWTNVSAYGSNRKSVPHERGSYRDLRFRESSDCTIVLGADAGTANTAGYRNDGTGSNVYKTYVYGKNAIGVVGFGSTPPVVKSKDGKMKTTIDVAGMEFTMTDPNTVFPSDIHKMVRKYGVKQAWAGAILTVESLWIIETLAAS